MTSSLRIKLLVFDIDGVLTGGETTALDYELFSLLSRLNQKAKQEPGNPSITICSGRAAPYVELMLQAIHGHMPAVYENGAGLYTPTGYKFETNPELVNNTSMTLIRQVLQKELVETGFAFFQPGKEHTLTLFACRSSDTARLQERITATLGSLVDQASILNSPNCVNILPLGMDKSSGIRFLAQRTQIDTANMLGVGDSDIDLTFLSLVGHSAAPANANGEVKAVVNYISNKPYGEGVRDILHHYRITVDPIS